MSPSTNPLDYQPCRIPLRRAMGVFGGINLAVHEGIYEDVLEADRRWRALGGDKFWNVRSTDTGSYACRNSKAHSRAVAIDFNWSSNGMTSKRTPCPGDMPAAFYELCWEPLGYGWGANWNSKCDRMHISKLRSEGGNGVLYQTWDGEDGEEEDLTENERKKLDYVYGAVRISKPGTDDVESIDRYVKRRLDASDKVLAALAKKEGIVVPEGFGT